MAKRRFDWWTVVNAIIISLVAVCGWEFGNWFWPQVWGLGEEPTPVRCVCECPEQAIQINVVWPDGSIESVRAGEARPEVLDVEDR